MVTKIKPTRIGSSNQGEPGKSLQYENADMFKRGDGTGPGEADMKYADFNFKTLSIVNGEVELALSGELTPTSDFELKVPAEIKDGQVYILRVNNGGTVYTMTLGNNFTNPHRTSLALTKNATDTFVFLAVRGNLELQPDEGGGSGPTVIEKLNIQRNGIQVAEYDGTEPITANIKAPDMSTAFQGDDATSTITDGENSVVLEKKGNTLKATLTKGTTTKSITAVGESELENYVKFGNNVREDDVGIKITGESGSVEIDNQKISMGDSMSNMNLGTGGFTSTASEKVLQLTQSGIHVEDPHTPYDETYEFAGGGGNQIARMKNIFSKTYPMPKVGDNLRDVLGEFQNNYIIGFSEYEGGVGETYIITKSVVENNVKKLFAIGSDAKNATQEVSVLEISLSASNIVTEIKKKTGETITVDDALSTTSENPVQNKVITEALDDKQDKLTPGDNIQINGTTISATDTTYTAGEGIEIKNGKDYSAMRGPCPKGFHVPSHDENVALIDAMTALGIDTSNGNCMKTYMKMPFAGYRSYLSAGVDGHDTTARYWSSTAYSDNVGNTANNLAFGSTGFNPQNRSFRTDGFSVRALKDTSVTPDSNWTTLFDGSSIATGAGIFHNTTDGLISISSDGQNRITIQDKNLGATTVYNDGDTLSEANCGKYFQRGNNYGFPRTGNVTTSSTKVDASGYGPGNYYESDTFITSSTHPYDWSNPANDNLRGGVTGVVEYNNAITNTGVLSVNGQTGDVVVDGSNTKTFYLADTTDLTTAQEAYEWFLAGKNPIIVAGWSNKAYNLYNYESTDTTKYLIFAGDNTFAVNPSGAGYSQLATETITLSISNDSVVDISMSSITVNQSRFLPTGINFATPYTPEYPGSPATKKYVDEKISFDGTPYTQNEYDALPSTKDTDGIWRVIYEN